jgi:hypothetical protein
VVEIPLMPVAEVVVEVALAELSASLLQIWSIMVPLPVRVEMAAMDFSLL